MSINVKHQALDELVRIKLQLVELQAKATQLEAIILGDTAKPRSGYGKLTSRILEALDHPMSTREIANACNNGGYAGTYAALKHTDSKLSKMVHRLPDGRWVTNDAPSTDWKELPNRMIKAKTLGMAIGAHLASKTPPSPASMPAKVINDARWQQRSTVQKQRYASAKANPSGLTDRQQACLNAVKGGAHSLSEVCRSVQGYSGAVYGMLQSLIKRGLITKKGWDYAIR